MAGQALAAVIQEASIQSISTRSVDDLVKATGMRGISRSQALNLHLPEIGRTVAPGAPAVLVLDGAGWHTSTSLRPPDAPEPNPVETVREYLRKNNLALRVRDTYDGVVDACCNAWNRLTAAPHILSSITRRAGAGAA